MQKKVVLKKGKEKPIINKHHWIFSGAIQTMPKNTHGEIHQVFTANEEFLGYAYFNLNAKIIGRMICFDKTNPHEAIKKNIYNAIELRKKIFENYQTNCYRLINGEGDFLPGLIVDKYNELLVIQISTLGIERCKELIISSLMEYCQPKAIYEKSLLSSRKEEGLGPVEQWLYGEAKKEVLVEENGIRFKVQPEEGQKTGFFLDQRVMRQFIGSWAKEKRVLNCFSYTGGFSVYAMLHGAKRVDSVDISEKAIDLAKENSELNGIDISRHGFFAEDVFTFLREQSLDYDIVILDPPAFAKKQKDVIQACRGYKDINRIAMQKMPKGSFLLTSSCSYHVAEELFQKVVFQAAVEAGRKVRIVGRHRLAEDHPVNICHPEGDYLKSLWLFIE